MEICLADDAKVVNHSLCLDRLFRDCLKGGDSDRQSVVVGKGVGKKEDSLCKVYGF